MKRRDAAFFLSFFLYLQDTQRTKRWKRHTHTKIERRKSKTKTRAKRRAESGERREERAATTHRTSKENDKRKINRKWKNQRAAAKWLRREGEGEGECVSVKEIDRDKSKGRERGCWDRRRRVIDRRSEEVGKKRKKFKLKNVNKQARERGKGQIRR